MEKRCDISGLETESSLLPFKITLLEGKIIRFEELASKIDNIYDEALGPFGALSVPRACSSRLIMTTELPVNDILTSALRTAQSELEHSQVTAIVERETMAHLNKALEAINNAVDEVARGNALLGKDSTYPLHEIN